MQIAEALSCSTGGINHLLKKYGIKKRSVSEAVYVRANPNGDPFKLRMPCGKDEYALFGLGLGLYWGEGSKVNKSSVSLCNSDPRLLKAFMNFMQTFFNVTLSKARLHIHIFQDIETEEALSFWSDQLGISRENIQRPTVIRSGQIGTYRERSKYGTATISYSNTKLRELMMKQLENTALSFGKPESLRIPKIRTRLGEPK